MFNFFRKKDTRPFIKIYADHSFELSKDYIDFNHLAIIDETYSEALAAAVLLFNDNDKSAIQRANGELLAMQEEMMSHNDSEDEEPFVKAINAFTNNSNPQ